VTRARAIAPLDVLRARESLSFKSMTGLQQPSSIDSFAKPLCVIVRLRVCPTHVPAKRPSARPPDAPGAAAADAPTSAAVRAADASKRRIG
jgi:hypothetical protein